MPHISVIIFIIFNRKYYIVGKVSFFLTMSSFFAPPKLGNIEKTLPTSWVLIICGDLPEPITVIIPDPHQWTVTQLKTEVEKKTQIPVSQQTIYCGETPLLDITKPLAKYEGLRNGIALCLARSNFTITAQRTDYGTTVEISIPRSELDSWTVKMVREFICLKFGFRMESKHYLISGPNIIQNDERKITDCPEITDGCTLVFTPLKEISIASPEQKEGGKRVHVPPAISLDFLSTTVYNDRNYSTESKSFQTDDWRGGWRLNVVKVETVNKSLSLLSTFPVSSVTPQAVPLTSFINQPHTSSFGMLSSPKTSLSPPGLQVSSFQPQGNTLGQAEWSGQEASLASLQRGLAKLKTSTPPSEIITLPEFGMTPVFKLRDIIHNKFSIIPKHQKITIGETILDDWDEEGKPLLLRNYPFIHDGATIHLEETRGLRFEAMTINVRSPSFIWGIQSGKKSSDKKSLIPSSKNLSFPVLPSEKIVPPSSINIHYPNKMTKSTLVKIVKNCEDNKGTVGLYIIQNENSHQLERSDENSTIDQMKTLQDGCVATTLNR